MKLFKIIFGNWKIKLACLGAAALLWGYVSISSGSIVKFPGAINIIPLNTPSGMVSIFDTKTVNVKIAADPSTWLKLSSDSFYASIDLSNLSEGTHEVPVSVSTNVSDVNIVEKDPGTIIVTIEPIIEKELTVTAKVEGSAADGMTSGSVVLSADTVKVRGAKSIVSSISEVYAVIHLDGESSDFQTSAEITPVDVQGDTITDLTIEPNVLDAKVSIVKSSNIKTIGIVAKTTGSVKNGYKISQITTTPATIDLVGSQSALSAIDHVNTNAVNVTGLSSSTTLDTTLNLTSGMVLVSGESEKVTVKIVIEAADLTTTIPATINFSNINSSYVVSSFDPANINLNCSGPVDIINNLTSAQVVLNLDLSSYAPTIDKETISINLSTSNFSVPNGVSILGYWPTSLTVILQKK